MEDIRKKKPTLHPETEEIYLRPMELMDTEQIIAWRNKDRVRHNFIYQKPFTREGHLHWIHTQIETGRAVQFMICEKAGDRAVGSVYFRDIDEDKKRAEYGIFIGEDDAVGKGYGTGAARLALSYAFGKMGLLSVFLRVFADNTGARRSYEKAGFTLIEGKQEDVVVDGVVRNMVFYEKNGG
ncbi:MAG: GNAT family N-acetyltransferase [Blautia sp.]|nr:GNAT family N-acetyltransferase [Lachnoclostridium sp.]MCM1211747.1 GNAT family N-acetyltransferase [Blautia sp.]